MSRSSEDAAEFVHGLASLAGRLSSKDLVVSRLHCGWASFGSWSIEVQRGDAADAYGDALLAEKWDTWGPKVVRITWDGRERNLVVAAAPTPPLSAPNQWETIVDQVLENQEGALAFAENYLAEWNSHAV